MSKIRKNNFELPIYGCLKDGVLKINLSFTICEDGLLIDYRNGNTVILTSGMTLYPKENNIMYFDDDGNFHTQDIIITGENAGAE